jgi:uncharacterized phage-associated protein
VWSQFGYYTGIQLSKITHEPGTAWSKKKVGELLNDEDIANDGEKWFGQ